MLYWYIRYILYAILVHTIYTICYTGTYNICYMLYWALTDIVVFLSLSPEDNSSSSGSSSVSSAATMEPGWTSLALNFSVQWPLHIFFTPAVLEKLVVVFAS